jgi:hypothetical protein
LDLHSAFFQVLFPPFSSNQNKHSVNGLWKLKEYWWILITLSRSNLIPIPIATNAIRNTQTVVIIVLVDVSIYRSSSILTVNSFFLASPRLLFHRYS